MKLETNFNTILLVVAIIVFSLTYCHQKIGSGGNNDTLVNTIKLSFDSAVKLIPQGQTIVHNHYNINVAPGEIPSVIDSNAVIAEYYRKHVDTETRRDTDLELTIIDTLFKNSRIGRGISYKILRPQTISQVTAFNCPERAKLYIGGFAGYDAKTYSLGVALSLIAAHRPEMYSIDYSLSDKFPDNLRVRYMRLLSFGKKLRPP